MTFYFYDLETSGVSARRDRVMQFAGQRTDMELKPIGEPDNILIKLTPDVLPDPYAILVTGITPQQTLADGITEAEALKYLTSQVFVKDTIILGYNSVRFDDEFMRFMLWRNFYDAYEWQWKDGCSRWDLLDVVRMTRALRPEGIKWPYAPDGKPTNRLSFLTELNKLEHVNAHDALSDVTAAIDVARLLKSKQPKLFEYLLNLRGKKNVSGLVSRGEPFIYTSGRYPSEYGHTTAAIKLADHPDRQAGLVYDLRQDPEEFIKMKPEELARRWSDYGKEAPYFPVKILVYNRCPAIAPMSVLDEVSAQRLSLEAKKLKKHQQVLTDKFKQNLLAAMGLMKRSSQAVLVVDPWKADEQLYDGFLSDADKIKMARLRAAEAKEINSHDISFSDQRLNNLLPLYKARNYPKYLTDAEWLDWEKYRQAKLSKGGESSALAKYFNRLNELAARPGIPDGEKYLLEELRLYGESVAPSYSQDAIAAIGPANLK